MNQQRIKALTGKPYHKIEAAADAATIYIYDIIEGDEIAASLFGGITPKWFIETLANISSPIVNIRINSPGGDVWAARAIEAAIRGSSATIVIYVDGLAASAASLLVAAGDKVIMGAGSFIMIHKALMPMYGNADDYLDAAGKLSQVDESLAATYVDRTGLDLAKVKKMMAAETWISAPDAVAMGFADSISEFSPKNEITYDLSGYKNAPAMVAPPKEDPKPAVEAVLEPVKPVEPEPAAPVIDYSETRKRAIALAAI